MGRASIGVSLPSGADKEIKAHNSKRNNKAVSEKNLCTAFSIQINKVKPAKSVAILRWKELA